MIIFRNKGAMEIAAACTLGVSVKDEGAIGHFGTGIKFAIATILRGGGAITIYSGGARHQFASKPQTIRGVEFALVTMDGAPLGFTTQLGRDWKPWMAFRELGSNARDEGGEYFESDTVPECGDDETVIVVDWDEFDTVFQDRHLVLLETTPFYRNRHIEIRHGAKNYVYYRGVRIHRTNRPLKYTYNLLDNITLTEDRSAKYEFQIAHRLQQGLALCDDEEVLRTVMTAGPNFQEFYLTFSDDNNPSQTFLQLAAKLRSSMEGIHDVNQSVIKLARQKNMASLGPAESVALSSVEQQRFDKAKAFLTAAGYDMEKYEIVVLEDLGAGVHGLAMEGRIFISKLAFQKGTKEVASTLLEEWVHLTTGFRDETRQLQTWLFDELLTQAEQAVDMAL